MASVHYLNCIYMLTVMCEDEIVQFKINIYLSIFATESSWEPVITLDTKCSAEEDISKRSAAALRYLPRRSDIYRVVGLSVFRGGVGLNVFRVGGVCNMCRAGGVCNMCRAGGVCNMCRAGGVLWCVCRAGGNMCRAGGMCAAQEVLCGVCAAQEVIMFRVGGLCAAAGLYLWATVLLLGTPDMEKVYVI